ncbi:MAG: OmpP1/FadL family transporter [Candidatus Anammoxibacter sp.]
MAKRYFTFIFAFICAQVFFFNHQLLLAQIAAPPQVKSIPLPTGSGARALGQGGAFIAVADDATAASWNPAGLIQLEKPEASIVGSYLLTDQDFSVDNTNQGLMLGDEDVGRWDVNFMSIAYPFRLFRKNFVAALNYHQILDFHADISIDQTIIDLERPALFFSREIDFKSSGGIGALSPAIAVLLAPKITFGLTVNIFDDEFFNSHGWTETVTAQGKGFLGGSTLSSSWRQKTSSRDYHGANVSLGLLWDAWEKEDKLLTFGAVFHSQYTARFDQEIERFTRNRIGRGRFQSSNFSSKSRNRMDWPMSIGLGVGYRHTDALSFSFDVTWTDWSEWVLKTKTNRINGERTGFPWINSRPLGGSEHDEIDDTFALRLGSEYLLFREKEIVAFRGGLFYEPRPSMGSPTGKFDGAPTDVWGFSLGTGITTKRFSLDAAYQFRFVRDMEGQALGLPGTELDTVENLLITSLIVYF